MVPKKGGSKVDVWAKKGVYNLIFFLKILKRGGLRSIFFAGILKKGGSKIEIFFQCLERGGGVYTTEPTHHPHLMSTPPPPPRDTNLYDFIDLYSVSVIAVKCAISCYMGLRYNTTLVISFMNVMPVLWHVPVCVCDMRSWWDVVREKIDRVKTAPHCNWLNALSTTS